jgi:hypothetical protein
MNKLLIVLVSLLACGFAFAGPMTPHQFPFLQVGTDPASDFPEVNPPVPVIPPILSAPDIDLDGFAVTIDCNDRDPSVKPSAVEMANGIDDNCDGVVDEGLDTTIDWPTVELTAAIWPASGANALGEHLSSNTPPRIVWTGDGFVAIWVDVLDRLRIARFGLDAVLAAPPGTLRRPVSNLDAVWTGTRLAIVYEDARVPGTPSVRLMILDRDGIIQDDVVLAAVGGEPKIAWGQDRLGVVWKVPGDTNVLRFQRFDFRGRPLTHEEVLESSNGRSAITFDGTIVTPLANGSYRVHEGMFGVVYEARSDGPACEIGSKNLLLKAFPREEGAIAPVGAVRVNGSMIPQDHGMPTIAANQSGFLVGWNTSEQGQVLAKVRYFTHDALTPSAEFTADADAGRYGRLLWSGGEFLMVNDNETNASGDAFDVHFRRFDATGNSHFASPQGAWTELNLREHVRGTASVYPDVVNTGGVLGVVWVERDAVLQGTAGRLWFAVIAHK